MPSLRIKTWTIGAYATILLVLAYGSFKFLSIEGSEAYKNLSRSTLIYTRSDTATTSLLPQLIRIKSMSLVDAAEPGASDKVLKLTKSASVATPLLIVPDSRSGELRYSGTYAVSKAIAPLLSDQSKYSKGRTAVIVTVLVAAIALFYPKEARLSMPAVPIIASIALAGIMGGCVTCRVSDHEIYSNIAPLLGSVFFAVGFILFTINKPSKSIYRTLYALLAALVPLLQLVLLTQTPKLCPSCLAVTFCAVSYFSGWFGCSENKLIYRLPRVVNTFTAFALVSISLRSALVAAGIVSNGIGEAHHTEDFVGHSIREFIGTATVPEHPGLFVVTLRGCNACVHLKTFLSDHSVKYTELSANSDATSLRFFSTSSFPLPLILRCDGHDLVTYQRFGGIEGENPELLLTELKVVEEKK